MRIVVEEVEVPAWFTIGYGFGYVEGDESELVTIGGDHRMMRAIAREIALEGPVVAEAEEWQVLAGHVRW